MSIYIYVNLPPEIGRAGHTESNPNACASRTTAEDASQPEQRSSRPRHKRCCAHFRPAAQRRRNFRYGCRRVRAAAHRPDEFAWNEAAARPLSFGRAQGRGAVPRNRDPSPLTSRHARETLTTLRPRRCVRLGSLTPAAGVARWALIPVGCRRRITRTRLGCYGRDPRDSGEGVQDSFRSGRGSLCTVI